MPQMAPIWWSTMFLTFIIMYIIVMIMVYFYNIYLLKIQKTKNMKFINNMNWTW